MATLKIILKLNVNCGKYFTLVESVVIKAVFYLNTSQGYKILQEPQENSTHSDLLRTRVSKQKNPTFQRVIVHFTVPER